MSNYNRRRRRFDADWPLVTVVVCVGALVLSVVGGFGFGVANALHEETRVCTVEETSREVYSGSKGSRAVEQRVYTEECGILTVEDALFAGAFNSADTFRSLEDGKTYEMTTRGWRIGFLSAFPNVIEAVEVR